MKIIDLSQPIHPEMWVYPGDSKVNISMAEVFADTGWNMRRIEINSHDGTHVNVPIHATVDGKNLDDYQIHDFLGNATLYESEKDIKPNLGLIFNKTDITWDIAKKVVEIGPKFIGMPAHFEFDIEIERYLLEQGIISFERLEHTDKLPKHFFFHGVPLKIQEGDGSPVRAYAIVE